MIRRQFIQLAAGLLVPAPERIRAYSFLNPAWMAPEVISLGPGTHHGEIFRIWRDAGASSLNILEAGAELFRTTPIASRSVIDFRWDAVSRNWKLAMFAAGWAPRQRDILGIR